MFQTYMTDSVQVALGRVQHVIALSLDILSIDRISCSRTPSRILQLMNPDTGLHPTPCSPATTTTLVGLHYTVSSPVITCPRHQPSVRRRRRPTLLVPIVVLLRKQLPPRRHCPALSDLPLRPTNTGSILGNAEGKPCRRPGVGTSTSALKTTLLGIAQPWLLRSSSGKRDRGREGCTSFPKKI